MRQLMCCINLLVLDCSELTSEKPSLKMKSSQMRRSRKKARAMSNTGRNQWRWAKQKVQKLTGQRSNKSNLNAVQCWLSLETRPESRWTRKTFKLAAVKITMHQSSKYRLKMQFHYHFGSAVLRGPRDREKTSYEFGSSKRGRYCKSLWYMSTRVYLVRWFALRCLRNQKRRSGDCARVECVSRPVIRDAVFQACFVVDFLTNLLEYASLSHTTRHVLFPCDWPDVQRAGPIECSNHVRRSRCFAQKTKIRTRTCFTAGRAGREKEQSGHRENAGSGGHSRRCVDLLCGCCG